MKWSEEQRVTQEELFAATKRMASRGDLTPGPDGIPGRVWADDPGSPPAKPVHQMREGRSILPAMENGEVDPTEQGRMHFALAVRV
jgi:hypothetical protein